MKQKTSFSYEEFWDEREPTPSTRPVIAEDGWVDTLELEEPAPPWVRVSSRRDPFPPCSALRGWPRNYPVAEMADLDDAEMGEDDPQHFVFSEVEMEAWAQIVAGVLDPSPAAGATQPEFARVGKDGPGWDQ